MIKQQQKDTEEKLQKLLTINEDQLTSQQHIIKLQEEGNSSSEKRLQHLQSKQEKSDQQDGG